LLPHTPGFIRILGVRAAQAGPDRLPVLFDKSGRMLEIQSKVNVPGTKPSTIDISGKSIEIEHVQLGEKRNFILLDKSGAVIQPRPAPPPVKGIVTPDKSPILVRKVIIDKLPIFIDSSGTVIEVEQGEAFTDAVLQAQNGSLIYYAIMVNDVYAYFRTQNASNPSAQFPTSSTDLNAITTFAASDGTTFPDPAALTVELKSSWIEAAGLPNLSSYITTTASIPTYDTSNPALWKPTGQKTVLLALVGMHFVGSVNGHPEMIWATFEHVGNTPNATYQYINKSGSLTTVTQDTTGTWLFASAGSNGPFNEQLMTETSSLGIQADPPAVKISPSNTIRWKAWGAAFDVSPNPIDGTSAASNSEIISINNSVRAMIASGDIRSNYIMTGATWTIGGAAPNSGNEVGTSQLANSTMETYDQGTDNTLNGGGGGLNCLDCHSGGITATQLSHIYGAIKPLF
jgi:hypothetical protein